MKQRAAGRVEMQRLLMPLILQLTPEQQIDYARIADELNASGFETEPFGNRTIAVKAAPANLSAAELDKILYEILEIAESELQMCIRDSLYALGAVVYEMAAGRPLYASEALGTTVQQILEGAAAPLQQLRPDLPKALCAAVDRAVSPRPAERFNCVQAFVDELRKPLLLYPSADVTPTATIQHPSVKLNVGRRKWWLGAGFAALLAIAAAIFRLAPAHSTTDTLVVLPFENLGADPSNQALCAGLQETVTSVLSTAEESRNTVMIVPSSEVRRAQIHTISEARKQFNATLALTGSAQETNKDLQLTLNLSDARKLRLKDVYKRQAWRRLSGLGRRSQVRANWRASGSRPCMPGR